MSSSPAPSDRDAHVAASPRWGNGGGSCTCSGYARPGEPAVFDSSRCPVHAKQLPEARSAATAYHPDTAINAGIVADALDAERADLAAGYAPKFWRCPDCGAGHSRGHFQVVGVHRCLRCGYVGTGGTMHTHDARGRAWRS